MEETDLYKECLIDEISEFLKQCNDVSLLRTIYKILVKSGKHTEIDVKGA